VTEQPKRRWIQLHLITLVILAVVAGVLIWVNCREQHIQLTSTTNATAYGWPQWLCLKQAGFLNTTFNGQPVTLPMDFDGWMWKGVVENIFYALAIIAIVAIVSERLVQWRRHDHR
jgi:hypothetical protein